MCYEIRHDRIVINKPLLNHLAYSPCFCALNFLFISAVRDFRADLMLGHVHACPVNHCQ